MRMSKSMQVLLSILIFLALLMFIVAMCEASGLRLNL